jgi:hypothetical protein
MDSPRGAGDWRPHRCRARAERQRDHALIRRMPRAAVAPRDGPQGAIALGLTSDITRGWLTLAGGYPIIPGTSEATEGREACPTASAEVTGVSAATSI